MTTGYGTPGMDLGVGKDGRCLSSQAALPPSGLSRQEASQAEPAAANAVRIAVVQDLEGYLTVCGPNDHSEKEHPDPMSAAICWHLESGHLPAATYWVVADLPPIPSVPELRAQAEAGIFPKTFIDDLDNGEFSSAANGDRP